MIGTYIYWLIVTLFIYLIYQKVIVMYLGVYFYKRQGIPFIPYILPFIGNTMNFIATVKNMRKDETPFI